MSTNINIPNRESRKSAPDLVSSLVVILISAAITIFVFWISSQYLGQTNFSRLPDFITGVYKGLWSSVVTGATGIGLAIVRALTTRGSPQPNYLKLIGITTVCFLVPITILITAPPIAEYLTNRKTIEPPSGVVRITGPSQQKTQFDLEMPTLPPPVYQRYVLRGTFAIENGIVKGHLDSGKFEVNKELPKQYPGQLTRVSFRACFIHPINGIDQMDVYPTNPKARDSIEINVNLSPDKTSYEFPPGDFEFDLPTSQDLRRAWLCAGIWNDAGGYFPAQ